MKILDSDHCVAILRAWLDLTGRVAPDEELATTAVSVGELVHGATRSQHAMDNIARLDVLLAALTIQIASIALEHDAVLVTHNQKHFSRLTSMAGLVLEDWLA
jgi:predicted nucleic acid-binding protein